MRIQKSYLDQISTLYLVPTPIGNFDDMTYRAVEILNKVDYIFCEDTRVTKVLLSHFNITTPLMSYHIFNEEVQVDEILQLLNEGKFVALVSDAGMPCISDPGFLISKKALEAGYNVISLPGANAALTALVASGIPNEKFYFYGFLSSRKSQREKQLQLLRDTKETMVFYEAPHRIKETLDDMLHILGDREIVLARELTKKYEEYLRGFIEEILTNTDNLKGEMVIIVSGAKITQNQEYLLSLDIKAHYQYYIDNGYFDKEAMKKVAEDRKISKSDVYKVIKV